MDRVFDFGRFLEVVEREAFCILVVQVVTDFQQATEHLRMRFEFY